ncbi:MAG: CPXCG motif-containing cysteine-rich protein [Candidatus Thiodiazotropha sp.]
MNLLETTIIGCPYCGENIEILVDRSMTEQSYIEDCSVCCRPITLELTEGMQQKLNIIAKRDDE